MVPSQLILERYATVLAPNLVGSGRIDYGLKQQLLYYRIQTVRYQKWSSMVIFNTILSKIIRPRVRAIINPREKRMTMMTFKMPRRKMISYIDIHTLYSLMEGNYSDQRKLWLYNIRHIKFSTTRYIDLCVNMNLKSKRKWELVTYRCSYTSVTAIGNGFV